MCSCTTRSTSTLYTVHVVSWIIIFGQLYNQIHSSVHVFIWIIIYGQLNIWTVVQPDPQYSCTVLVGLIGLLYMYNCPTRSTAALYSVHLISWIIKYVQLYNQIHINPVHCTCSYLDYYIWTVVQPDPQQPCTVYM